MKRINWREVCKFAAGATFVGTIANALPLGVRHLGAVSALRLHDSAVAVRECARSCRSSCSRSACTWRTCGRRPAGPLDARASEGQCEAQRPLPDAGRVGRSLPGGSCDAAHPHPPRCRRLVLFAACGLAGAQSAPARPTLSDPSGLTGVTATSGIDRPVTIRVIYDNYVKTEGLTEGLGTVAARRGPREAGAVRHGREGRRLRGQREADEAGPVDGGPARPLARARRPHGGHSGVRRPAARHPGADAALVHGRLQDADGRPGPDAGARGRPGRRSPGTSTRRASSTTRSRSRRWSSTRGTAWW